MAIINQEQALQNKLENRNIALQWIFDLLNCLTLLFAGGTVWQGLLLHCGLSSTEIGILTAAGSVAQVVAMALDLMVADRFRKPLRIMSVASIPMLLFFCTVCLLCLLGEHAFSFPLALCCVLLYYSAYGFRSIFSYKIPYLLIRMERYGRTVALSGFISNGLCVVVTIGINLLLENFAYLQTMTWLYGLCALLALVTVLCTLWMKPIYPQKNSGEPVQFREIITHPGVTKLSAANFIRGISMGIIGSMTLIAAGRYKLDAATLSLLASLTTVGALLGNLLFSALGKAQWLSRLCLAASITLTVIGPISVLGGWDLFLVWFVVIQIAYIIVNGTIPVMLAQSTSYRVIGGCTAVRMMETMAGSALSGWLTGMLLDKSSGIAMTAALMLAAGLAQLYCGIAYHKYQKPARNEE